MREISRPQHLTLLHRDFKQNIKTYPIPAPKTEKKDKIKVPFSCINK